MKINFILMCYFFSLVSFAQELSYPELNVTPRASERIKLELKNEHSAGWGVHMPIQLSALSTLIAGAMSTSSLVEDKKEEGGKWAPVTAIGVGAIWIGVTSWATLNHRPYREAYLKLKKMPYNSKREKLTLERLAEEELDQLRKLGRNSRWLSFATNLAASTYLLDNVESGTDAQVAASLSTLLSFTPLLFKYRWEDVYEQQEKYKKKIFSPIAMGPIFNDPFFGTKATGLNLSFIF